MNKPQQKLLLGANLIAERLIFKKKGKASKNLCIATGIGITVSCEFGDSNIRQYRVIYLQEKMRRRGSIKGLFLHLTWTSSNHFENVYLPIHRSQRCLWCGLEMRIFKNKILEKVFFNHTIQSFNEYLTQAPNTACCQFFSQLRL